MDSRMHGCNGLEFTLRRKNDAVDLVLVDLSTIHVVLTTDIFQPSQYCFSVLCSDSASA